MNVIHNPESVLGKYNRASGGTVTCTQGVYNRMGVPIYVIMRSGFSYVIHPSLGGAGRFAIDDTVIISNDFMAGANCDFNVTNHPYSSEPSNKKLYDEWLKSGSSDLAYYQVIYGSDFLDGSVYVDLLDIVISVNPPGKIPLHPRSHASILNQSARILDFTHGFTFQVKLVNNTVPEKELINHGKYINVNGIVSRIQPIHDRYVTNGLYILTNDPVYEGQWQFYPEVSDKCPVVLYDLPEIAKSRGDVGKRLEEENKIRVQELKVKETQYKTDLLEVTRKFEEESRQAELNHKEQLRLIEVERAQTDATMRAKAQQMDMLSKSTEQVMNTSLMRQKAMYEGMSYARKNTSENIKMIPTVLNFITTFFKF